jgi:hypothetical protein
MKKALTLFAVAAVALIAGSCNSGRAGNFALYMTDAPIVGLEHVYITFSQIEVRKDGEDVFLPILTESTEVDLLELRDREEKLVDVDLEPATYAAIRLTISAAQIVYEGQTYTLTIDPPKVVTVPVSFTVAEDGTVKCLLDFDAAQSVSENGGLFSLAPVIIVKSIGY